MESRLLVIIAVGLLIVLQLGLQIWALVDLFRRPEDTVAGGRKWVWALVILLGELIGVLVYSAAGRTQPKLAEGATPGVDSGAARSATDVLYGDNDS